MSDRVFDTRPGRNKTVAAAPPAIPEPPPAEESPEEETELTEEQVSEDVNEAPAKPKARAHRGS